MDNLDIRDNWLLYANVMWWSYHEFSKTAKKYFHDFWKNKKIILCVEFRLHIINRHRSYVNQKEEFKDECN